jgi:hypothetical protein
VRPQTARTTPLPHPEKLGNDDADEDDNDGVDDEMKVKRMIMMVMRMLMRALRMILMAMMIIYDYEAFVRSTPACKIETIQWLCRTTNF